MKKNKNLLAKYTFLIIAMSSLSFQTIKPAEKAPARRFYYCKKPGCSTKYTQKWNLQQHEIMHKTGGFKCDIPDCNKAFPTKRELDIHSISHTKKRPFPCTHPDCRHRARRQGDLTKHMRTHTKIKPYSCSVEGCNKRFARLFGKTEHMRRSHGITKRKKGGSRNHRRKVRGTKAVRPKKIKRATLADAGNLLRLGRDEQTTAALALIDLFRQK